MRTYHNATDPPLLPALSAPMTMPVITERASQCKVVVTLICFVLLCHVVCGFLGGCNDFSHHPCHGVQQRHYVEPLLHGRWTLLRRLCETTSLVVSPHHVAVKTRNITVAIQFYSLLGFEVEARFRAGPARAAWLTIAGGQQEEESSSSRLELIEVPSYLLHEPEGRIRRAVNLMERQELLGWNHLAFNVTHSVHSKGFSKLSEWMQDLNATSWTRFGKSLRVALEPRQQIIGNGVYELGFIYDADGALVEFVYKQSDLEQEVESGWDVWDGKGFV